MVDEHILRQLDNDTNVIGYKPILEYKKERTATGEAITSDTYIDGDKNTVPYSKTLQGFAENLPSKVLQDIDYVLKNIARLKNKLANKFNEDETLKNNPYDDLSDIIDTDINNNIKNQLNDINQLVRTSKTGNEDFAQQFERKYDHENGSVIPALINHLNKLSYELENLSKSMKELYYGDTNITTQDAQNLDQEYLNNLRVCELKDKKNQINYLTLSFDAILNKTVSYSVFQNNKSAIKVAKVIDSQDEAELTQNDMDVITQMYNEIDKELKICARGYMRNEEQQLTQKAMYNYYEKRKILNDTYTLARKNQESKFLHRKCTKLSNDLTDAIKNVNRVLLYDQNYFNKITDLEKEKYIIQKLKNK